MNSTTDADIAAIIKTGEEFFAGTNTGDLEHRMATMADEVIVMPHGRPAIVGKEEMRRLSEAYQAMFEERCVLTWDEIESAGDWGFARATVDAVRTTRASGEAAQITLKNLWIFKRQTDGEWKFWRIMTNSDQAPSDSK